MMKNSNGCGCNDYANLTALTGIATINTGTSSLTGSGSVQVISAPSDGLTIKSVTIKAAMPVTDGMVRLFVGNGSVYSLYKEIPIPTTPALASTPTPAPFLPTFETVLDGGGLKLAPSHALFATTQNSETFNIIADGLSWSYQSTLPPGCCSFKQEAGATGLGTASVANPNLDGTGTIATVFTAPSSTNGSLIRSITIKALQSTNLGMVRLFISPNGTAWTLMREISIPVTTQSGFDPSFKAVLEDCLHIQPGYFLGASTQVGQSFALTVEATSWTYPAY